MTTATPFFHRLREVMAAGSRGPTLAGTILLPIIANSCARLCTAGFLIV